MSKDNKTLLRKIRIYEIALKEIASATCCGCCTEEEPEHCEVGVAKQALKDAKR